MRTQLEQRISNEHGSIALYALTRRRYLEPAALNNLSDTDI